MFRKAVLTLGACAALITQPAIAQEESEDDAALAAMMAMFQAEPLTAEQEARLPLATEVVGRMIPDGAMGEMMGSMFDGMLGPIMDMTVEPNAAAVAEQIGLSEYDLTLADENVSEALAILDPVWVERKQIERDMMPQLMKEMMDAMEPTMRKAMSEVYAVHFTTGELAEINTFFKTETGANFARKSFTISSDPRLLGSMMESMPAIMGTFATMEQKVEAATAELPEARGYDDLTPSQRERLAQLVGMDVEGLEVAMAASEAAEEIDDLVE